ncbi:MAG: DNA recombination protein RecF [Bacteroidetes bacterium GWF2_33_16]|nr:MAG: DNA recombination protein RecF [Bacteroidetes bacterium GWE2_32_14]OFY07235.1 MAG: DNA recombination protein RecF [Bacteroidetes bacterium GWF2_33_16]
MYLKKLSVINFKNYNELEINFSAKINCFIGRNGVGKTNLLDAIYYLSMCKSYLNPIDIQNIKYDEDFFVIQGEYTRNENTEDIYCGLKRTKKKIFKRNKKEYEKLSDHIGLLPIVMISPLDNSLILEGSEERRRFMDSVISQYDKDYLDQLIRYNRALAQRNKLLKDFYQTRNFDLESLEIWDDQLIGLGEKIHSTRVKFVENLIPIFQDYYNRISENREKVDLIYDSQLYEGEFKDLLKNSIDRDRMLQYTTIGIHKDDLTLSLNGFPIKKAGSQGQQKTLLVSLKLAQFDFIKQISGLNPVLLLDDIFDKFDKQRVRQIIELVAEHHFGQIFITDTNQDRLEPILREIDIDHSLFIIESNGNVAISKVE